MNDFKVNDLFNALLDESLSSDQRKLYQKVFVSSLNLQTYKAERKELLQKYKSFSSFIFGIQSEEYKSLISLPFENYDQLDEQINFLEALSIVNTYLLNSDFGLYVSESNKNKWDIQECFTNYRNSKKNVCQEISMAIELYQLIVQILTSDHEEALRIKKSLLDIVGMEDRHDFDTFCVKILEQFRLLYKQGVIDESMFNISINLFKHYLIYSENEYGEFVMTSDDGVKKNIKHK